MVLVVGATGLVGLEICQRLARKGERVRGLVRDSSLREKVEALRSCGVEIAIGDLKNPESIRDACRGADAVISTASSTLSRQAGDTIESVDGAGQLNLVKTARTSGVERFVFLSFRQQQNLRFPLADAKRDVEDALTSLNFSVIQASWFMEVWLSPTFGFDYPNAAVRIYGPGTSPISWVSYRDVAEMCCVALRHPGAERETIEFGGPEALSPVAVVGRFEKQSGRRFKLDQVPEEALRKQFEEARDSMEKSIAALMLGYLYGDAITMTATAAKFGLSLTSVDQYARSMMGKAASA